VSDDDVLDRDGRRRELRDAYRTAVGPPPDEVDEAISVLRRARAILGDADLMRAVQQRHAENRAAVKADGEGADDNG
jgi:hypothetical protein